MQCFTLYTCESQLSWCLHICLSTGNKRSNIGLSTAERPSTFSRFSFCCMVCMNQTTSLFKVRLVVKIKALIVINNTVRTRLEFLINRQQNVSSHRKYASMIYKDVILQLQLNGKKYIYINFKSYHHRQVIGKITVNVVRHIESPKVAQTHRYQYARVQVEFSQQATGVFLGVSTYSYRYTGEKS